MTHQATGRPFVIIYDSAGVTIYDPCWWFCMGGRDEFEVDPAAGPEHSLGKAARATGTKLKWVGRPRSR